MTRQLPDDLRARLGALLEGVSRRQLAEHSQRLTADYRAAGAARFAKRLDLIAYAVARMPGTYAALDAALDWSLPYLGGWQPQTLLDLGSGPGTGIWAVGGRLPALRSAVAIEQDPAMARFAKELGAPVPVEQRLADIAATSLELPGADIVLLSYVLGELAQEAQGVLIDRAWRATGGVLVLVEPGTPAGAGRIGRARERLIAADALLLAPCPHALACPMAAPDWCHMPARLARSRDHMAVKAADVPFEDEKFSFLVVSRTKPAHAAAGRIVGPPQAGKPQVVLPVCRGGRIERVSIPSRDRAAFRASRKLAWGDALPENLVK